MADVMVVDDEKSVLFTYRLLVEREGYTAKAVDSAKGAIEVLKNFSPDLLMCDLSLEEKRSGFEVIDFARRDRLDLPCVLLTGYATEEIVARAKASNIPVLHKPIEIEEFIETLNSILGKSNVKKDQT